jgi:large subunit ribosomal protein L21
LQSDLKLIRGGPRKLFGTKALYASRSNIIKIKMYAIVEIAGQQFKVEEGKKIFVHRLDIEDGKNIDFDHVLLIEEDGNVTVGEPIVKDASVQAKVIEKVRGEKVIVFKKKRKKGYRIKNFTQVEIISINGKTAPKKHAVKKDVVAVAEEPVKEKKAESKKPAAKKPATAAKKTAEKKPAAKKPEAKKPGKGKA